MFFDLQKGTLKQRKGIEIWLPRRNVDLRTFQRGSFRPKEEPKRELFRVFRDEKGPVPAAHPVRFRLNDTEECNHVPTSHSDIVRRLANTDQRGDREWRHGNGEYGEDAEDVHEVRRSQRRLEREQKQ